jgi:uncharacterized repeat protein (TIGR04138 family)
VVELQLANEILDRIRAIDGRYHERAYLFVLAALEYCQQNRTERGHISGPELAWACRDLAMEQFGLTSKTVFGHWGIHATDDIGKIVFVLIEVGLLMPQDNDRIEDFHAVYNVEEAFEEYPWAGVGRTGGGV